MNKMPERGGFAALMDYSWAGRRKRRQRAGGGGAAGRQMRHRGIVGDDAYGQFCVDDFKRHNIDTSIY